MGATREQQDTQTRFLQSYLSGAADSPLDFLVGRVFQAGLCDSHTFLNFSAKVAPELLGGGRGKEKEEEKKACSSSPSPRAKINFLVCRMVGHTVQGLMGELRVSVCGDVFSAVHLAGLGSSTEDTKKQVLQLFFFLFLAGQIPTERLGL